MKLPKLNARQVMLYGLVALLAYCLLMGCRISLEGMENEKEEKEGFNGEELVAESQGLLQGLLNTLMNVVNSLFGAGVGVAKAGVRGVSEAGSEVLQGAGDAGRAALETTGDVARVAVGTAEEAGQAVASGLEQAVSGVPSGMSSSSMNFADY